MLHIKPFSSLRFNIIDILRGTSILQVLKELRVQQYYSKAKLEEIKTERFNSLFETAKLSTEYYKNCISYEDLKVLTKDRVRKNFDGLISSSYQKKLYSKGTGGSTGTPLVYLTTAEAQSYMWASLILSWEVAGYQLGDKVAFVGGSALFGKSYKHMVFHKLLNMDSYSTYTLNDKSILEYIHKIQKAETKIIFGYPTALNIIANYINKNGPFSFPHLKGIISTSEILTESCRNNITNAFNVNVFNQYGCNEAGIYAFECEHHRMHLINTRCKYELDKDGNLLTTDLVNKGFIMMKYLNGDKVEFSSETNCPCKRNFPILKSVIGRSYDLVKDLNNNVLHAAFFNSLFRKDERIEQFQIIFDKSTINIYLKVGACFTETILYNKYLEVVKKHLRFKEYNLVINAPFMKSNNAKHRYVINTEL